MDEIFRRRLYPRRHVGVEVTLMRDRGSPIRAHTLEIGGGGMRIESERPLAVDEVLNFDLPLHGYPIEGHARVLREHGPNVYALRFEVFSDSSLDRVLQFVDGFADTA